MIMKIDNIKMPVLASESELFEVAIKKSRLKRSAIKGVKILKKSVQNTSF